MIRQAMVVLAFVGGVAMLSAQAPAEQSAPAFEVASVKVNDSGSESSSTQQRPNGTFQMINVRLTAMVAYGYDVRQRQIVGGPDWIHNERFDVLAKAPEGSPGREIPAMLRTLLAERFRLVTRAQTMDQPIYALVFARSERQLGPQIKLSTRDCSVAQARPCGVNISRDGRGATMQAQAVSLSELAGALTGSVDRVVVDRTGVEGAFDVDLRFTQDGVPGGVAGDTPSIFAALQEQLGLKLEPSRGPVEVVVIDSVQRPTPD
jgi:uncharacterized protein (TIGR03435 family)